MKKTILLVLSVVLFAGIAQANHWNVENQNLYSGYTIVQTVVQINGVEQTSTQLELGAFCGEVVRGSQYAAAAPTGRYIFRLRCYGDAGDTFSFRLYDAEHDIELDYLVCEETLVYRQDPYGTGSNPYVLNFTGSQSTTYTLAIPGYGSSTGGYHLIASPVTEEITPSVANGFLTESGTDYDLYYFDQTNEEEWINFRPNGFNIVSTKGYLYASKEGTTLQFTGTPYSGNGNIPLVYAADSPSANMRGWNLIGNPYNYLVSIDKDNYYIMNEDGDDIIVADGTPITPMQGFFVHATREGESVTLSEYQAPFVPLDGVVLNLSRNRGNTIDRAIVRLGEGSTLPKFMLNPNNSKIYIEQDGDDYAVVNSTANELPVSFKAASNGTYTLNVAVENTEMYYLHLIDNIAGTDTDLLANPSYTFEANTGDHANRFTLVMSSTVGVEEHFAFYNGHNWTVSNPSTGSGPATLQVIDMTGRVVSTKTIDGTSQLDVNAAPGVYMFRLVNGSDVKVQKVVVR